jgi:hypothetical protein
MGDGEYDTAASAAYGKCGWILQGTEIALDFSGEGVLPQQAT